MKRTLQIATLAAVLIILGMGAFLLANMGLHDTWGLLRYDARQEGALKVGDRAPDVALVALDGASHVRLADRIGQRPLVLTFGSFT